ncbi:MAG: hypothetical protein AABX50_00095 [Nanoarchaeota archaeon]
MAKEEVLYEDPRLKISYFPERDLHSLLIDGNYSINLDRGILEELSKTPLTELRNKIDILDPSFINYPWSKLGWKISPLSSERIGYAISQARIKELEDELRAAYSDRT